MMSAVRNCELFFCIIYLSELVTICTQQYRQTQVKSTKYEFFSTYSARKELLISNVIIQCGCNEEIEVLKIYNRCEDV